MIEGSCLCGSVRYRIEGQPALMYHCHCDTCRAASGASYATNILVPTESLVIEGRDVLSSFESSPRKRRYFCSRCGSPIYSHSESMPAMVSVRCGTLKTDPGLAPSYHAWVGSKAPWTTIADGLTHYDQGVS